jgi:hypothetical protein
MQASHIWDLHSSQNGRPMIRCCGRISSLRMLHLLIGWAALHEQDNFGTKEKAPR